MRTPPVFLTRAAALARWLTANVAARVDQWTHARRHRNACGRLGAMAKAQRILIVCQGNVCRSPYLEARLSELLPGRTVTSAGFSSAGRFAPANAVSVAGRHRVDLSTHRSRALSRDLAQSVDVVIVMDANQASIMSRNLAVPDARVYVAGDFDPERRERRAIRDPWHGDVALFEATYARLDRCAQMIAAVLAPERISPIIPSAPPR